MNLKQLEAFVCVAEGKSFSKAAKKLYLTQPTISAHIQSLERELGEKLLDRTTKEVTLSLGGERLYSKAKQMIQIEEDILTEFQNKEVKENRKVIVGASTIPGQYILPGILSLFCETYPESQLEILENDSLGVIQMILAGEIEVGFTGTKIEDTACVFEPFYFDKLVVITPNTEKYQRYETEGFPQEQFYKERLIVREDGSGTRKETEEYFKKAGIDLTRLNIAATINNQETIKKFVSNGMGIAVISKVASEDYVRQGAIRRFPLAQGEIHRKLYMVWNKNKKPDRVVRMFIQFVRELYEYL